jgi:peptidoglycan/xylan/chitin deacetylase (PgdA/CDA1 family)
MSKQLIRAVARAAGALSVARYLSRNGVRILYYHRFGPDTRGLARQCEHIRRYYHPVSLHEIAQTYERGHRWPPNAVAVTIDDGYRDFLMYAHPVFKAYGIPTTMFLVSDFLDGRLWLWPNTIEFVLARTAQTALTVDVGGERPREFKFETATERRAASLAITAALKEVDNAERLRVLGALVRELDVRVPVVPPPEYAPLTWDEVRQLSGEGVEFGAHTKSHPMLSRVSDRQCLEDEIVISKSRIESETGREVVHFCYPSGRFSEAAVDVLNRSGFHTAVTTQRGINFAGSPRFLLRRLGAEPDNPMGYFQELLSGIRAQ